MSDNDFLINLKNDALERIDLCLKNISSAKFETKNDDNFNRIKALIYSMKEMRDWYYIKEIVKKVNDNKIINPIYCTSNIISCLRSSLYEIDTLNIYKGEPRFITYNFYNNNKKYLFYKQISPLYTFLEEEQFYSAKQQLFNFIMIGNSNFIKQEISGGSNNNGNGNSNYNDNDISNIDNNISNINKVTKSKDILFENKIHKKIYHSQCISMDYKKIRYEIYCLINSLTHALSLFHNIHMYKMDKTFFENISNGIINDTMLIQINHLYAIIKKIHDFCNKYTIDILKCIDYTCMELSEEENTNKSFDIQNYKQFMLNFKRYVLDNLDETLNVLVINPIYPTDLQDKNILSQEDLFYSVLIRNYVTIGFLDKEKYIYNLKMSLPTKEYELIRNVLYHFDDEELYFYYLIGLYKFELNDKNEYHIIECTDFTYYKSTLGNKTAKDFEKKYESKYEEINKQLLDRGLIFDF